MKITERILIGLGILGILLRMLHWPGGNIALVLSLSLLAIFYFAGSYFLFNPTKVTTVDGIDYKQASAPRVTMAILTGMSLPVAVIGILFKVMYWPGAAVMLLVGAITLLPFAVVALVTYSVKKEEFYKEIAFRTVVVLLLSAAVFFL